MLNQVIELCTSTTGLYWLILTSDLSIALAYFAIPLTMAIVLRHRKEDIPCPWLWTLFVLFIAACGLTHTVHAWSAFMGVEYLGLQAAIDAFTALASVGTAIAFAFILPQIKLLPSPRQQRERLQVLVAERTKEKDQLIREINHRIGNQLQVLSSIVSIEIRKAASDDSLQVLGRLRGHLQGMAKDHVERSQQDYLGKGIRTTDGRIVVIAAPEAADAPDDGAVRQPA
jgi:hypothetical protein